MKNLFARWKADESGATAIEYGLIAAILGLGVIAGLTQVKNSLGGLYTNINNGLN